MRNIVAGLVCTALLGAVVFAESAPTSSLAGSAAGETKGAETKIKGCLVSEEGRYMLQAKRGKAVALSGLQELGSHVGHMVTVHGTRSTDSASTSTASHGAVSRGRTFVVSKLDLVSTSCGSDNNKIAEQFSSNGKPSPYHKW
jgi:hypothetical protein